MIAKTRYQINCKEICLENMYFSTGRILLCLAMVNMYYTPSLVSLFTTYKNAKSIHLTPQLFLEFKRKNYLQLIKENQAASFSLPFFYLCVELAKKRRTWVTGQMDEKVFNDVPKKT